MTCSLRLGTLALAAALLAGSAARADDPPPPLVQALPPSVNRSAIYGDHWGVISATTDAPGHDVLSVELGFPGVTFGYTHGMSDTTDWGIKLALDYGVLYTTHTQFGIMATLPLRMIVAQNSTLSLLMHIDPGFFTYASSNGADNNLFGLIVPVGASVGFTPVQDLRVSFGVDLPLAVQFLHSADFFIGPQFGGTVETFVDKHISIGLNLKFGPMFVPTASTNAQLGFVAQATLGYRL